jgi:hypothetical protein
MHEQNTFEEIFDTERIVHEWDDPYNAWFECTLYYNCVAKKPIKDTYSKRTINVGERIRFIIHSREIDGCHSQAILLDKKFCKSPTIDILKNLLLIRNNDKKMQDKIVSAIETLMCDPYQHHDIIYVALFEPCHSFDDSCSESSS